MVIMALAAATSVPIATGEIEVGRWRFAELMGRGGAIHSPDGRLCLRWHHRVPPYSGDGVKFRRHPMVRIWFHDLHAHLVASTPNARYVEFFPDDQVLNFRRLVDTQIEVRRLYRDVAAPRRRFDLMRALDRYAMNSWTQKRDARANFRRMRNPVRTLPINASRRPRSERRQARFVASAFESANREPRQWGCRAPG